MHDGEPVSWSDALTGVGTILAGIGTLGLAAAAGYAAFVSLGQYLGQRRRETTRDLARLQGDLVARCQREYDRAKGTADEPVVRGELERAEVEYEAIMRGIMLTDREMQKLRIEALHAFMELARRERERLRREIGG